MKKNQKEFVVLLDTHIEILRLSKEEEEIRRRRFAEEGVLLKKGRKQYISLTKLQRYTVGILEYCKEAAKDAEDFFFCQDYLVTTYRHLTEWYRILDHFINGDIKSYPSANRKEERSAFENALSMPRLIVDHRIEGFDIAYSRTNPSLEPKKSVSKVTRKVARRKPE